MVLQNLKTQDREQILQLMLPRCELCKLDGVVQKAAIMCNEEGCNSKDQALCTTCWKLTHSSMGQRTHHFIPASICRQCQQERIAYWCAECDLQFCSQYFDQIHSIFRTKRHRKLAIEAQKHPARATSGKRVNNTNEKRKRNVEVIVLIDDDEADESEKGTTSSQLNASHASEYTKHQFGRKGFTVTRSSTCTQAKKSRIDGTILRPNAHRNLQQASSTFALFQDPEAQPSSMKTFAFSHELARTSVESLTPSVAISTGSACSTPMSNESNTFLNKKLHWNHSAATASPMGNERNFETSAVSNEMMHVSPTPMTTNESNATGVWPTSSAINSDLVSTFNPNNLLPLGGAVFAENALVDSLVDRYHEVNQNVTNLELQTEHLTRQIAVATCQGPYTAAPIMALLSKLEPMVKAAILRRDKLFVAMVVQSNDIMNSVRLLQMAELGDVPQVPMIGHRKCLQMSDEINQHKSNLIELNNYLSGTLSQSHALNSSYVSSLIRTTSAQIHVHETKIKKLKMAREVEIVRIVQISVSIREKLKQAIQRAINMERQQHQRP